MINMKSALLLLCLSCIVAVTWGQGKPEKPGPVKPLPVKPLPVEPLPVKPFPWFGCHLSRRSVPWIHGCRPLSPVYQTTCSGLCHSMTQTNPAYNPFVVTERCICCKATSIRRVSVKMQCPVSPLPDTMTATCDNYMKVYFDGVLQPDLSGNANNWGQASTFTVPVSTQVVGIECEDVSVVGGILASFSNGMVTDESWQCSTENSTGWALPSYAGTWASAYEIGSHGVTPWNIISGISGSAQWIWTEGWHGEDAHVYCRRVIKPKPLYTYSVYTYNVIDRCGCRACDGEDGPDYPDNPDLPETEERAETA